jgi:hypothetical protein
MVHSVLEMAPVVGFAIICLAHPGTLASLVDGKGSFLPLYREPPLPSLTVATVLLLCALFGAAPYAIELAASIRVSRDRARARAAQ